jgi:hypothetical protein
MHDFIPYLLREEGSRLFHIGQHSVPLCGAALEGKVERLFLPERLGMAHGVCADCRMIYEREKMRVKGESSGASHEGGDGAGDV